MASAIEVVSQVEGEAVAQILLDAEVGLLRVGVNEILGLWIAEGLKGQRQEGRRVQVVLVQENGVRLKCIELLLVGKVAKVGIRRRRYTTARIAAGSVRPWKIGNRIQIRWVSRAGAEPSAGKY